MGKSKAQKQRKIIQEAAKSRMSLWASRLLDPNRDRAVLEPNDIIPLNDDFLQSFGRDAKRKRESLGLPSEFDQSIDDDETDATEGHVEEPARKKQKVSPELNSNLAATTENGTDETNSNASAKVRISNLRYTTAEADLERAVARFGEIKSIKLFMSKENPKLNAGRAIVVFEKPDAAAACIDGLRTLHDRPLVVILLEASGNKPAAQPITNRYWLEDISTKCFLCGQVGHIRANCPNPPKLKPCPLCAKTDHDLETCPLRISCFNCGKLGHQSRACTKRPGLPPRRMDPPKHQQDVLCMVCRKPGHTMCKAITWFHKMQGEISCDNCGRRGHSGDLCTRPNVEECRKDFRVHQREIARNKDYVPESTGSTETTKQKSKEAFRRRAKSAPPPKNRNHAGASVND